MSKEEVDKILKEAGYQLVDDSDKNKDKIDADKKEQAPDGSNAGQATPGAAIGSDNMVQATQNPTPETPDKTAQAGSGDKDPADANGSVNGNSPSLQAGNGSAPSIDNNPSGNAGNVASNNLGKAESKAVTSLKQETGQCNQMSASDTAKSDEKAVSAQAPATGAANKESAPSAGASSAPAISDSSAIAKAITDGFKELHESYKNTQQKELDILSEKLGIKKQEAVPSSRVSDDFAIRKEAFNKAIEWFKGVGARHSDIPTSHGWYVTKDEVMQRYFGVDYSGSIPSTLGDKLKQEAVTVTGGDMPQYFSNQIHRIPGGQIPLNIRPYCNFVDLTNQDRANWYKIDKTTVYTMSEGTEPTASSQTVTKITATPAIRIAYQKVGYSQIENAPFDLVQAIQDHMALNLINDEATDLLSTVYDAVSVSNWVNAATGGVISSSDDIASMTFKRDGIVAGKRLIANQGHDVRPGNLVLFLHPKAYQELLLDTNLTNFYQWAQPGITQRGVLEMLYGVEIVVANQVAAKSNTTNSTYRNVLAVKGVAFGLASARDITFEAQKRNELQQVLITATQRVKSAVIDETATCRISSAQ